MCWSGIGGLQVARASSFLQYLTKWGIHYYIASKYLLRIYFRPPRDALNTYPLVTLLEGLLGPLRSYFRDLYK
jgi:hypothetical protein